MPSGVSASAKSRAAAGPVVWSLVRSESKQATSTRKGSCHCAATSARAVTRHPGTSRRSRRMVWPMLMSGPRASRPMLEATRAPVNRARASCDAAGPPVW